MEEDASYDVRVTMERAVEAHPKYQRANYFFDVGRDHASLYFSGVGEFIIRGGREIVIIPTKNVAKRMVELYLSGVVIAVLLYLRGFLVFHGSCIANDKNEAVALVGDSGAGKSTLAALLQKRGYAVLSDDIVALKMASGEGVEALPAFPLLKITIDLAKLIGANDGKLLQVHEKEEKYYLPVIHRAKIRPCVLKAICFLEAGDQVAALRLSPRQVMMKNISYTMPTRLLQQAGNATHFNQCAEIAATIPSYQLTRSSSLADAPVVADKVENLTGL